MDTRGAAPEDAFVAATNTCVMMMFIWAAERFKLDLQSYECYTEGKKLIELDRTEIFTDLVFRPGLWSRQRDRPERVRSRWPGARSSSKYSLVANSVKSNIMIEPTIEVVS
jgi:organic hydroperoxide reductase OsmC/OhrA